MSNMTDWTGSGMGGANNNMLYLLAALAGLNKGKGGTVPTQDWNEADYAALANDDDLRAGMGEYAAESGGDKSKLLDLLASLLAMRGQSTGGMAKNSGGALLAGLGQGAGGLLQGVGQGVGGAVGGIGQGIGSLLAGLF